MGESVYDLEEALREAAEKFREKVRADPDELMRRLARRGRAVLGRPVRAWCLAVRAADLRINGMRAGIVPLWGRSGQWVVGSGQEERGQGSVGGQEEEEIANCELGEGRYEKVGEEVVLDARLLREICRPVHLPFPGVAADEAARMLGCGVILIRQAIKRGQLEARYVRGLGGRPGKAVPVVYARRYLDPCSFNGRRMADPLWGTAARFVSEHVPEELEQEVERVRYDGPGCGIDRWLWVCPGCGKKVRMLFYPLPELGAVRIFLPEELKGRMGEGERGDGGSATDVRV